MNQSDLVEVAKIVSPFGVRGEFKVKLKLEDGSIINEKCSFYDELGHVVNLQINKKAPGNILICSMKEINTPEDVSSVKGKKLFVSKNLLPKIENDEEFYYADLLGLKVFDENQEIGVVVKVMNHGAGDLLELQFLGDKENEIIIFNKENFPVVNVKEKKIVYLAN